MKGFVFMLSAPKIRVYEFFRHTADGLLDCFDCMCRFAYLIGIQTARVFFRFRRRCLNYLRPVGFLVRHLYSISLGRYFYRIHDEFASFRLGASDMGRGVRKAKKKDLLSVCGIFFRSFHKESAPRRRLVCRVLNIAAPVACFLILFSCVHYWNGRNFSLVLSNQGKTIGTIQNEKVYEEATEMVNQRMVHDTSQEETGIKFMPSFRLTSDHFNTKTPGSVCDLLIQQSNGIIEEASGLYVDGELKGSVKSSADLRYMLQNRLSEAKGNDKDASAHFVKNVEIVSGLYPTTSIITTDAMRRWVNGTLTTGTTYTVKAGDTAASIAAANKIALSELKKINGNLVNSIKPGDLIRLQVAVPNLEVELIKTVTYEVKIPLSTVTQNDDSKYSDYSKVLVPGSDGKQRCVDVVHIVNGLETKRENVSKTLLVKPVNKVILTGTKKRPVNEKGVPSGKFMWPVPALQTITSPFGMRWGAFHKGIDISGSSAYGSTIVAADGGIVSLAGWNDGYGRCVIIDHQNGKRTLYGHCSALFVSDGEAVSKGQPIARVGSSGDSTGSHLHFEVIVGGSNVNPLRYVS